MKAILFSYLGWSSFSFCKDDTWWPKFIFAPMVNRYLWDFHINIRSCNLVWYRLGILCAHLDPFGGSCDASLCVWVVVSLWLMFWVEIVRYTLSQLVDLFRLSLSVVFSRLSFLALKSYLLFCNWSCLLFVDLLVIPYFIFAKLIAWLLPQQVVSKQFGIRSGVWAKFMYCFYHSKVYILFFFKELWL